MTTEIEIKPTAVPFRVLVSAALLAVDRSRAPGVVADDDLLGWTIISLAEDIDRRVEYAKTAIDRVIRDAQDNAVRVVYGRASASNMSTHSFSEAREHQVAAEALLNTFGPLFTQMFGIGSGAALALLCNQLVPGDRRVTTYNAEIMTESTSLLRLGIAMCAENRRVEEEKKIAEQRAAQLAADAREAAKEAERIQKLAARKAAKDATKSARAEMRARDKAAAEEPKLPREGFEYDGHNR